MTNMKRVTIALPAEIDRAVMDLKKDPRFERNSYSEIVRMLLAKGIEAQTCRA